MKNYFKLGLFLLLIFAEATGAEIIQTASLDPIRVAIEKAEKNTLVVFDVDDTLITPKDQILGYTYRREKFNPYYKAIIQNLDASKEKIIREMLYYKAAVKLVDPTIIPLLKQLQAKKIKIIALTASPVGKIVTIKRNEDWRYQVLFKLGIDFSQSFSKQEISLVPPDTRGEPSLFKKGIIYSGKNDKGDILKKFLFAIDWKPKKIIFVDDRKENIETLAKMSQEMGISYCGFYYTAVKDNLAGPFNEKRAKFQMQILQKENRWLSDEEADKCLATVPE